MFKSIDSHENLILKKYYFITLKSIINLRDWLHENVAIRKIMLKYAKYMKNMQDVLHIILRA